MRQNVKDHSVFDVMVWDICEINAQLKSFQLAQNVERLAILD